MAVVQSQVSRKGYHSKTLDGALELFGLGPDPLLLIDNAIHEFTALGSHRCRGGPDQ